MQSRKPSRWWDKPDKVLPVKHLVECKVCHVQYQEVSDPRAEFGFCDNCRPSAKSYHKPETPVVDWWSQYWSENPESDPLPEDDPLRKEVKIANSRKDTQEATAATQATLW